MTSKTAKTLAIVAVAMSPCLFCICSTGYFSRVTWKDLCRIEKGMTREQVVEIVGRPNHTESDGRYWAYYTWDEGILAPFFPIYVSFDKDNRVQGVFS